MSRPARIRQVGPEAPDRIVAVEGLGKALTLRLEAGVPLVEAVRRGFAGHGFSSGMVEFSGLALGPFGYVMPALSKTGENAAFYSDIFRPAGLTRLSRGAMTFGLRDGAPFYHCHALWQEADGHRSGGHILPEETLVAETCEANALGLAGLMMEARPDPEINFKVFGPRVADSDAPAGSGRVVGMRLRPNQDFTGAIEAYCAANGIARARIRGGVGSTIGVMFDDGREMTNFATEVYIEQGMVSSAADGTLRADVDIGVVDYTGQMGTGRLKRGANPVLMTFELALEVL